MKLNDTIPATRHVQLHSGQHVECEFRILQYFDGSLEIDCELPEGDIGLPSHSDGTDVNQICGVTLDGQCVSSGGSLRIVERCGKRVLFRTSEVQVTGSKVQPEKHRYLLTNFEFSADERDLLRQTPKSIAFCREASAIPVTFEYLTDHQKRLRRLRRHKQPVPTATLTFASFGTEADRDTFASEICMTLSICEGHKVNWIASEALDAAGTVVSRTLRNRVTGQYSVHGLCHLIDPDFTIPLDATRKCFSRVRELQRKYAWRPAIEIWLEARTGAGYLETRGLKLGTALETLHATICDNSATKQKDKKDKIENITTELGLADRPNSVRKKFIDSRNSLTHEGRFVCESKGTTGTKQDEYFFMVDFVDRIILEAAGLGRYLPKPSVGDWG